VLPEDTNRNLAFASRTKTFILLAFVFFLAAFVGMRSSSLLHGADFPHFYCAARMLAQGQGHQLYDGNIQRQYQARYAGRIGTPYTHPPFEALFYVTVAWLPLRYAYVLWSFLTIALLSAGTIRLTREALAPWNWRLLLVAALTFVPSLICILQGQDSLLLLLIVVLAFSALRSGGGFAAGVWLGLGLFKFQVVLPLVLVLALTQNRSIKVALAKGFSLTMLALAAISIAISGWSVLTVYPGFLLHFKEQPYAGLVPEAMANFRGLTYLFFRSDQSPWAVAVLSILCAAALIKTLGDWKQVPITFPLTPATTTHDEFDLAFANTVLFTLLVSYHLNPHDLTLLLLPISLLMHRRWRQTSRPPALLNWLSIGLLGLVSLPPLHLWTLKMGRYALISLPMLALFLTSGIMTRQGRTLHIQKN
jgi:hypothetical protein